MQQRGPCEFKAAVLVKNTQETGVAKIRDLGRGPLAHTRIRAWNLRQQPLHSQCFAVRKTQQQEGAWSLRASTKGKALGKGSHPYKGHIHALQSLQHRVPPSAQSQEESRCYLAPTQGTWAATDCHSVPWRQTLGWGTTCSSPSPEGGGGIPGELPGNSCLSPTSDTSVMHLLHQLKACPDQRSGWLLLPWREEAHMRKSSQAGSLQAAAPKQTQRCHPDRTLQEWAHRHPSKGTSLLNGI